MTSKFPIINLASARFLQQLDAIEAGVWGTPCSVTLLDGSCHDICLARENNRYGDLGNWLNPTKVSEVRKCPYRLPARFAQIIRDAGESGMGYHIYVVELSDGNDFVHVAGNLVIDLLNLPLGYGPEDVVNVLPHHGRERTESNNYRQVAEYCSLEFARSP
jgi:hypothetical protein